MQAYDPSQNRTQLGYHRELTKRHRKDAGMTYPCNQVDVGHERRSVGFRHLLDDG